MDVKYFGICLFKSSKVGKFRYSRKEYVSMPYAVRRYVRLHSHEFDYCFLFTRDKVSFDLYFLKREQPFNRIVHWIPWTIDLPFSLFYRFHPVSDFDARRFLYHKENSLMIDSI